MGSGPAIDAVGRLEHDRLKFVATTPPQTVAAGDGCKLAFQVHGSATDPGGQALSQQLQLVLMYRDLVARTWVTTTPATLGYVNEPNGTYQQPQMSFRVHEETVEQRSDPALSGAATVLANEGDVRAWLI